MIIPTGKTTRIASFHMERCYFAVQNMNTVSTDAVYLMQSEEEPETMKKAGFVIGGYGLFEMQNCLNAQSKKAWFAYTDIVGGVDVRVMDI
ncbi:hypothetical protein [Bacteroides sp.]|uniref:hypothetical protein n=1 Tax=Bacteroides sp. TaxID=29523 RepID=UPI00262CEC83|nr:hypothetical protein [Bacteroides sp.]MDD3041168.1 hypothetical protein [Bacteroides sp.]